MDKKIRLLVVEDDPMIATDIKETLTGFGYEVVSVVASGERAIQEAAAGRPDLALMDIRLPGEIDGIEAAEQIRAQHDIPIIYLTAHSDTCLVERSKSTEPYGYLLKPFREEELRTTIEIALYKHGLQRELKEMNRRLEGEIIERVQAEETLREKTIYLDNILRSSINMAIVATDLDFRVKYYNPAAEEIIGQTVMDMHSQEKRELSRFEQAIEIVRQEGEYTYLLQQKKEDGLHFIQSRISGIWDKKEGLVGLVLIAHDITEQLQAEKALRQYAAQLEAIREVGLELTAQLDLDVLLQSVASRAVTLLEAEGGGLYLYRPERDVLEWAVVAGSNVAPVGTTLRRGESLAGQVWETGQTLIVDDYQRWEGRMAVYEGYPLATIIDAPIQWGPVGAGGEFLGVLSVNDNPTRTFTQTDAELLGLLANQAAIAIKNAQLYEQARQDAQTKAVLLQEVNHRVKNNLAAIVGMLYIEKRFAEQSQSQRAHQAVIADLISRAEGLARAHHLLSVSEWSPLLVEELVEQIVTSALQALPPDKRVLTDIVCAAPIQVSPQQAHNLALVINELTTNVVKYAVSPQAEMSRITIQITMDQDNETILIEFRDNGPGFPEEVLRSEHQKVGLYLIQNIIQSNLRGEVTLNNDHGAVTTFRFPASI